MVADDGGARLLLSVLVVVIDMDVFILEVGGDDDVDADIRCWVLPIVFVFDDAANMFFIWMLLLMIIWRLDEISNFLFIFLLV